MTLPRNFPGRKNERRKTALSNLPKREDEYKKNLKEILDRKKDKKRIWTEQDASDMKWAETRLKNLETERRSLLNSIQADDCSNVKTKKKREAKK